MLGQLFVKDSSKPLEKMLRDIMEQQGSMRLHRAEWKMTPARFSGAVALGSEPRPQIAKETPGKSRETQVSKFI